MVPLPTTYKRQVWDYKKANAECIWHSISSVDWNVLFQGTSVNQNVMVFNKHLMNIFQTLFQTRSLIVAINGSLDDRLYKI